MQSSGKYRRAGLVLCFFAGTLFQSASVRAQSQSPSVEELQQRIRKRDAMIVDLMRRVEALEQKLGKIALPDQLSTVAAESGKTPSPDTDTGTSIDIGEEETSRALERTLVRERAIVLRPWSIEIEPRYTYTYRSRAEVRLAVADGQQLIVQRDLRRDRSDANFDLRIGLPWSSQLDFILPFSFIQEESARGGSSKRRRAGWGDIQLGWTKQLLNERGWLPDLLTTFNWKSKTGETDIGSGFHGIQASLTAVKRRDPLAFFGSVAHNWSLSRTQGGNDIDRGNTVGVRLGTLFATSPDTSLRFALDVTRSGRDEVNRMKIPGTNQTAAVLEFGVATVILPRALLDVRTGIGLTSDSPDFRFGVSLPIRLY
jgi:hypothetical protein